LPILEGFREELLPALVALWIALLAVWLGAGHEFGLAVAIWATVTTIMLWPVGRRLGRPYLSYRRSLFLLGVLSMAYIPAVGFVLQSGLPYWAKVVFWLLLPADLTVFAILPSLPQAIGRPIRMFSARTSCSETAGCCAAVRWRCCSASGTSSGRIRRRASLWPSPGGTGGGSPLPWRSVSSP